MLESASMLEDGYTMYEIREAGAQMLSDMFGEDFNYGRPEMGAWQAVASEMANASVSGAGHDADAVRDFAYDPQVADACHYYGGK